MIWNLNYDSCTKEVMRDKTRTKGIVGFTGPGPVVRPWSGPVNISLLLSCRCPRTNPDIVND